VTAVDGVLPPGGDALVDASSCTTRGGLDAVSLAPLARWD
jgi:hypothetical protein